jgi:hypothetical protein
MVNTVLLLTNGGIDNVVLDSGADLDNFQDTSVFKTKGTGQLHKLTEWTIFDTTMVMYGCVDGLAGAENQHNLPPPVDSELYFGDILAVLVDGNGSIQDLTKVTYQDFYEKQFGGFENLSDGSDTENGTPNTEHLAEDSDFEPTNDSSTETSESEDLGEETEDEAERNTSESDYSDLVDSEDETELAKQLFEELQEEGCYSEDEINYAEDSTIKLT